MREINEEPLEITYVPIGDIKPYKNNAKIHTQEHIDGLSHNMSVNGFTNPILIGDDNVVIAGHGRLAAAKQLGRWDKLPCIYQHQLDTPEKKKGYTIADNSLVTSKIDEKMMMRELLMLDEAKFDMSLTGLDDNELEKYLGRDERDELDGTVKFSDELLPSHNYVLLYFDNEMDWLSAKTHFNLESLHSKRQNGKPWSKGIGRVINGSKYLTELKDENSRP